MHYRARPYGGLAVFIHLHSPEMWYSSACDECAIPLCDGLYSVAVSGYKAASVPHVTSRLKSKRFYQLLVTDISEVLSKHADSSHTVAD